MALRSPEEDEMEITIFGCHTISLSMRESLVIVRRHGDLVGFGISYMAKCC